MFKIIPTFGYGISIQTEDAVRSVEKIKSKLLQNGGRLIESYEVVEIEIPASKLSIALNIIPNLLSVKMKPVDQNDVAVTITRVGERRAALVFLVLITLVSVFSLIQNQDYKALMFPPVSLVFIWIFSLVSFHPAHRKLRDLMRFSDEESSK